MPRQAKLNLDISLKENHHEFIEKIVREKCHKKLEEANRDYKKICKESDFENFKKTKTRLIANFEINIEKEKHILDELHGALPLEFDINSKDHVNLLKSVIAETFINNNYVKPNIKDDMYSKMHNYFIQIGKHYLQKYKDCYISGDLGKARMAIENRSIVVGTYGLDNNGGNGRCEFISNYLWVSESLRDYLIDPSMKSGLEITNDDFLYVGCQAAISASMDQPRNIIHTDVNLVPSENNILLALPSGLLNAIKENKEYIKGVAMLFMGAGRTATNKIAKEKSLKTLEKWLQDGRIDDNIISSADIGLISDTRKILTEISWKRDHFVGQGINQELNYEVDGYDRVVATIPLVMLQKYGNLGILYRKVIVEKDAEGNVIDKNVVLYECRPGMEKLRRIDSYSKENYENRIDSECGYVLLSTGTISKGPCSTPNEILKQDLLTLQLALAANRPNGESEYRLESSNKPSGPYLPNCEEVLSVKSYESLVRSMRSEAVITKYLGGKTGHLLSFKLCESNKDELYLKNGLIHTNYFISGREIENIFEYMLIEKCIKKWKSYTLKNSLKNYFK